MDHRENTATHQHQVCNTSDEYWQDEKQMAHLRKQAQACSSQITSTFCQASIVTVAPNVAQENYRNRVSEALLEETDTVLSVKPMPKMNPEIKIHQVHLKPPSPVVLYEDPIKCLMAYPSTTSKISPEEIEQTQELMQRSRNTAILMEEMRSELLNPVIGIIACILLIILIGVGVHINGMLKTDNPTSQAKHQPQTTFVSKNIR